MQLYTGTSGNELLPNVATIGFFDGVHRGHRFLIEQVCKVAATWACFIGNYFSGSSPQSDAT